MQSGHRVAHIVRRPCRATTKKVDNGKETDDSDSEDDPWWVMRGWVVAIVSGRRILTVKTKGLLSMIYVVSEPGFKQKQLPMGD